MKDIKQKIRKINKIKIECGVCWGGGKIEYDDLGNEKDCDNCNGKGYFLSPQINNKNGLENLADILLLLGNGKARCSKNVIKTES